MPGRVEAVLIEGDGIGPEITSAARRVLDATGIEIDWEIHEAGARSLERTGQSVPTTTLEAIRRRRAALKGPFSTPSGGAVRSANWTIRRELDLYASLRPIESRARGIDVLLVRENVEDLYGAIEWSAAPGVFHAVRVATRAGCERIARFAFELAERKGRRRVTVVHKANNLKLTEGLFLDVARETAARHPSIACDDMLVDTAAEALVSDPTRFDVILTTNTFGDILSSVGAALVGGNGVLPCANSGGGLVVVEAAHGSAPALAGTGRANPAAMIRAGAMLLEALGFAREAAVVWDAVDASLAAASATPDPSGTMTTGEVGAEVARRVAERLRAVERA